MLYLQRGRFIALLLLALSLPFELDRPLFQVGPLAITNLELFLGLTLGLTAIIALYQPWQIRWPERYWLWLLPFCLGMVLAAAFAPAYPLNALKASLRLMSGLLLALAIIQIEPDRRVTPLLAGGLLLVGFAAALLGLAEIIWDQEFLWLTPFRPKITRAGEFLRLTGPFDYANQAAMFIEATLFLFLPFIWQAKERAWGGKLIFSGLLLALLLYLQAAFLTFSRASFVTLLFVSLFFAIVLTVWRAARQQRIGWFMLAAVVLLGTGVNSVWNSPFRLRLQAGTEEQWYRTRLEMPETVTIAAAETILVPVTITNEGTLVWRSEGAEPILLGGRWVDPTTQEEFGQVRWPFPEPVHPGETVQMDVPLRAPAKVGLLELRWDVVQENVTWFGQKSGVTAVTQVVILPGKSGVAVAVPTVIAWEYVLPIPERRVLWQLAGEMWREHPWLGIGLDNFRLQYGERLGVLSWNDTVHTNNWYIEMVVSLGLLGSIPFFLWLFYLLRDIFRTVQRLSSEHWPVVVAAALLTFIVHGLLDFFLLFNATGLLFWLLVGLWTREKHLYARRL